MDMDGFWARVDASGDCWEWTGATQKGYGLAHIDGRNVRAHRHAYETLVGPIQPRLVLDHLCQNRACVNPDHLEPVTDRINILRAHGPTAQFARRSHCINGHEYTPANTRMRQRLQGIERVCRSCDREMHRRIRAAA